MEIRRNVLGDACVDRALDGLDDFNHEFPELVTEYCWGGIWGRPGPSHRDRGLNNFCLLAAPNRPHKFETLLRGALRNGCPLDEFRETLLQIAAYVGIPAGVDAYRIARRVVVEEGIQP
jgi:4-carboxymuconolactone decarboxylase